MIVRIRTAAISARSLSDQRPTGGLRPDGAVPHVAAALRHEASHRGTYEAVLPKLGRCASEASCRVAVRFPCAWRAHGP